MQSFLSALLVGIMTIITQLVISHKDRKMKETERKDKFRLCALDMRLQKHQEAYSKWEKMRHYYLTPDSNQEKEKVLKECRQWWIANCLYLTEESSKAFANCLATLSIYTTLNEQRNQAFRDNSDALKELSDNQNKAFSQIQLTGKIITQEVGQKFYDIEHQKATSE